MEAPTERVKIADIPAFVLRSRQFERLAPFVWGAVAGLVALFCGWTFPTGVVVLASSITIGSIAVGFLATSMALLIGLDSARMRQLRDSGYIHDVAAYLRETTYVAVAFIALSMWGFFLCSPGTWYLGLWLTVAVTLLFAFRRLVRLMISLLGKGKA